MKTRWSIPLSRLCLGLNVALEQCKANGLHTTANWLKRK